MPAYYIWTIGCQMNKAESERLGACFAGLGYQPVETADNADIIILNSCVVRQSAESRVSNKIALLKKLKNEHPDKLLAVTGCFIDSDMEHLKKRYPHVDYFFKAGDSPPWLANVMSIVSLPARPAPITYVPIAQGCNNFCSYCIVPYRRGRERSRTFNDITCEVAELVRRGTREIVLVGQNVDSYGHDLPGKPELADLLTELNPIDGLFRLRFLTNHPKDMSPRLIKAIADLDKVCEQINLPVQSGSDAILKLMRRGYAVEHYRRLVERIRITVPDIALSTDVIVGFPSETHEQFQETVDLLSEIKFDTVHVAAYSTRPGTIAARELNDDVPRAVKQERLHSVETLQEQIISEINAGLLGKTIEVLVEGKNKGKWYGRSRTDKLVFFTDKDDHTAKLVNINITKTSPWSLQGKLEPNVSTRRTG
ncbi:MAG: tRNA (N6-isopentenyl adenosine(37)-C2)-methylthiotransferase MiaB [Dehalococcoidales bacterium]|nr:tRNA (N6-isopentenyl adenosine(37)-C2)-methylthiotransferase MiaB [Dehalococcoidales bacterium]